jgi:hypothetical protein
MSLAMTAERLEPSDANDNHNIGQKRKIMQQQQQQQQQQVTSQNNNNKTRKQIRTSETFIDNDKVNSVLASIHKGFSDEDDDTFANIQPLSASSEKPSAKNKVSKIEKMTNYNESDGLVPTPLEKSEMDLQKLENNYMNDEEVEKYYKKLISGYNPNHNHNHNHNEMNNVNKYDYEQNIQPNSNKHNTNNPVVDKLNYIINLLEEHQDQRTNNVTEEIILYSFLGVFIIFVVDGFTRVGKYVR